MAESNNWLKLNRSIIDSNVFENPDVLKVFIWILCKVNFTDTETLVGNTPVKLKAGEMIFGRNSASEQLGMNSSKCYRIVNTLEKLGTISKKSNSQFTVIKLNKWRFFQGEVPQSEQQMNSKRTASEQQMNSERTHYKNIKNYRNKEYIYADANANAKSMTKNGEKQTWNPDSEDYVSQDAFLPNKQFRDF